MWKGAGKGEEAEEEEGEERERRGWMCPLVVACTTIQIRPATAAAAKWNSGRGTRPPMTFGHLYLSHSQLHSQLLPLFLKTPYLDSDSAAHTKQTASVPLLPNSHTRGVVGTPRSLPSRPHLFLPHVAQLALELVGEKLLLSLYLYRELLLLLLQHHQPLQQFVRRALLVRLGLAHLRR